MPTLGQGPSPKKNPSSAMGRILLGMDVAEDKGGNLLLAMTLQIIPRNRTSTKSRKGQQRKGKCLRERLTSLRSVPCASHDHAFLPLQPLQQLEGRADGTSTYPKNLIHEEGNYYKREWRETEGVGNHPPNTLETPEKASRTVSKTNLFWKTQSVST